MPKTCPSRVSEPRQQETFRPGSPWRKSYGREKWGLPPIRPHHGSGDKELHLKRIGWLYPIFQALQLAASRLFSTLAFQPGRTPLGADCN